MIKKMIWLKNQNKRTWPINNLVHMVVSFKKLAKKISHKNCQLNNQIQRKCIKMNQIANKRKEEEAFLKIGITILHLLIQSNNKSHR